MAKFVYLFSEGSGKMRELLGGKGANLAEMTNLGMPVPQGFTVTTEACTKYYLDGELISDDIREEISLYLAKLEKITGKEFGNSENPLLVSVRSGARASMPGMMDTILNLGLNDKVVEGLAKLTGNRRFALDSYRRFIQMFSDVVMELPKKEFETIIDGVKADKGVKFDSELDEGDMEKLVALFKAFYKKKKGVDFPVDPTVQLFNAIKAVFRSWNNDRAIYYRRINEIPSSWGTAVNVQSMVFGNMGNDSGTGVAFTRNPSIGTKALYGEFLMNAQGEDVVAGIRTPQSIQHLADINPDVYRQFCDIAAKLELHYRDMQDMEFTIEKGKLYMLQTRNGKRTAQAAIKIAVDMVSEGLNTREEALLKVEPRQLDALLHPLFDEKALKKAVPDTTGLPASPGAACGKVYFNAEDAIKAATERKEKVILVRLETSPEDIRGMAVSQGILTARGGMTSHAAVVARGMGTCCVAGCNDLRVFEEFHYMSINNKRVSEGEYISLDGSTGYVYLTEIPTTPAVISEDFATFMAWADEARTMKVFANADNAKDARQARAFGAEGIGLCRTEHMFFEPDRIAAIREMIVSKTLEQRRRALEKLLPMQRSDFESIYREMSGLPVTIRFLDPPLHEFVPHEPEDIQILADDMGLDPVELTATIKSLHEVNPMLGHRGCRLVISYPEIAEMQTRAVIEAAINVTRDGIKVEPEIMIPLICDVKEFRFVKKCVSDVADTLIKESGLDMKYKVGTMIEIPRAALTADEIATEAEFFSFGTNDLTQTVFGLSRDDANKILDDYLANNIFEADPTARLDQNGVGKLVKMAADLGRGVKPQLKLGICGEHGGDPSSIEFVNSIGLNYVSCSPFRVPIARLAAAQAAIKSGK